MFDLFLFFHYYGQDVCSLCQKSLPSIYLARGRFPENGAKNSSRKTERCLTYFYFFIIMVTRMCALYVEKIRKVYRRFISHRGPENGAKLEKFTVDLSR